MSTDYPHIVVLSRPECDLAGCKEVATHKFHNGDYFVGDYCLEHADDVLRVNSPVCSGPYKPTEPSDASE